MGKEIQNEIHIPEFKDILDKAEDEAPVKTPELPTDLQNLRDPDKEPFLTRGRSRPHEAYRRYRRYRTTCFACYAVIWAAAVITLCYGFSWVTGAMFVVGGLALAICSVLRFRVIVKSASAEKKRASEKTA